MYVNCLVLLVFIIMRQLNVYPASISLAEGNIEQLFANDQVCEALELEYMNWYMTSTAHLKQMSTEFYQRPKYDAIVNNRVVAI